MIYRPLLLLGVSDCAVPQELSREIFVVAGPDEEEVIPLRSGRFPEDGVNVVYELFPVEFRWTTEDGDSDDGSRVTAITKTPFSATESDGVTAFFLWGTFKLRVSLVYSEEDASSERLLIDEGLFDGKIDGLGYFDDGDEDIVGGVVVKLRLLSPSMVDFLGLDVSHPEVDILSLLPFVSSRRMISVRSSDTILVYHQFGSLEQKSEVLGAQLTWAGIQEKMRCIAIIHKGNVVWGNLNPTEEELTIVSIDDAYSFEHFHFPFLCFVCFDYLVIRAAVIGTSVHYPLYGTKQEPDFAIECVAGLIYLPTGKEVDFQRDLVAGETSFSVSFDRFGFAFVSGTLTKHTIFCGNIFRQEDFVLKELWDGLQSLFDEDGVESIEGTQKGFDDGTRGKMIDQFTVLLRNHFSHSVWSPQLHGTFTLHFEKMIQLLEFCFENTQTCFMKLSKDVVVYAILPFCWELDAWLVQEPILRFVCASSKDLSVRRVLLPSVLLPSLSLKDWLQTTPSMNPSVEEARLLQGFLLLDQLLETDNPQLLLSALPFLDLARVINGEIERKREDSVRSMFHDRLSKSVLKCLVEIFMKSFEMAAGPGFSDPSSSEFQAVYETLINTCSCLSFIDFSNEERLELLGLVELLLITLADDSSTDPLVEGVAEYFLSEEPTSFLVLMCGKLLYAFTHSSSVGSAALFARVAKFCCRLWKYWMRAGERSIALQNVAVVSYLESLTSIGRDSQVSASVSDLFSVLRDACLGSSQLLGGILRFVEKDCDSIFVPHRIVDTVLSVLCSGLRDKAFGLSFPEDVLQHAGQLFPFLMSRCSSIADEKTMEKYVFSWNFVLPSLQLSKEGERYFVSFCFMLFDNFWWRPRLIHAACQAVFGSLSGVTLENIVNHGYLTLLSNSTSALNDPGVLEDFSLRLLPKVRGLDTDRTDEIKFLHWYQSFAINHEAERAGRSTPLVFPSSLSHVVERLLEIGMQSLEDEDGISFSATKELVEVLCDLCLRIEEDENLTEVDVLDAGISRVFLFVPRDAEDHNRLEGTSFAAEPYKQAVENEMCRLALSILRRWPQADNTFNLVPVLEVERIIVQSYVVPSPTLLVHRVYIEARNSFLSQSAVVLHLQVLLGGLIVWPAKAEVARRLLVTLLPPLVSSGPTQLSQDLWERIAVKALLLYDEELQTENSVLQSITLMLGKNTFFLSALDSICRTVVIGKDFCLCLLSYLVPIVEDVYWLVSYESVTILFLRRHWGSFGTNFDDFSTIKHEGLSRNVLERLFSRSDFGASQLRLLFNGLFRLLISGKVDEARRSGELFGLTEFTSLLQLPLAPSLAEEYLKFLELKGQFDLCGVDVAFQTRGWSGLKKCCRTVAGVCSTMNPKSEAVLRLETEFQWNLAEGDDTNRELVPSRRKRRGNRKGITKSFVLEGEGSESFAFKAFDATGSSSGTFETISGHSTQQEASREEPMVFGTVNEDRDVSKIGDWSSGSSWMLPSQQPSQQSSDVFRLNSPPSVPAQAPLDFEPLAETFSFEQPQQAEFTTFEWTPLPKSDEFMTKGNEMELQEGEGENVVEGEEEEETPTGVFDDVPVFNFSDPFLIQDDQSDESAKGTSSFQFDGSLGFQIGEDLGDDSF